MGGPLPSLLCPGEGRLPQRSKRRLAFLFKEKEGITLLDKGKELLAPVLPRVSAAFPLNRVTDVSDSGWQRPKRRKTKEERLMAALKVVMRDG